MTCHDSTDALHDANVLIERLYAERDEARRELEELRKAPGDLPERLQHSFEATLWAYTDLEPGPRQSVAERLVEDTLGDGESAGLFAEYAAKQTDKWTDIAGRATSELEELRSAARALLDPPFNTYWRWRQNGNAADADVLTDFNADAARLTALVTPVPETQETTP